MRGARPGHVPILHQLAGAFVVQHDLVLHRHGFVHAHPRPQHVLCVSWSRSCCLWVRPHCLALPCLSPCLLTLVDGWTHLCAVPDNFLYYSYSTCGTANTYDSWFDAEAASGDPSELNQHDLVEIASVVTSYLVSTSNTLEGNEIELRGGSPNCKYFSSCPCIGCSDSSPASAVFGNQSVVIGTSTYTQISDSTSSEAKIDQCLSNIVGESFTRVAAAEANPSQRLGYEYGAFQNTGNYMQWPGLDWCPSSFDPRFRPVRQPVSILRQATLPCLALPCLSPCLLTDGHTSAQWYAAAASGPKDVVIVIDKSGSMASENRMSLARQVRLIPHAACSLQPSVCNCPPKERVTPHPPTPHPPTPHPPSHATPSHAHAGGRQGCRHFD